MPPKKKEEPKGYSAEQGFILFLIAVVVIAFILRVIAFFTPESEGSGVSNSFFETITGGPNGWFANTLHFITVGMSVYVTIATIFSIVCFLAICYVAWLTHQVNVEEDKKKHAPKEEEKLPSLQSQKWQMVQNHVNSQNPAEWRLAILEADVMLEDMMKTAGFHGETIGDMLKNTPKGDFKTIDQAWEAHKIRNAIAHQGVDFVLSQRESKRIISLYETVFQEFSYV